MFLTSWLEEPLKDIFDSVLWKKWWFKGINKSNTNNISKNRFIDPIIKKKQERRQRVINDALSSIKYSWINRYKQTWLLIKPKFDLTKIK